MLDSPDYPQLAEHPDDLADLADPPADVDRPDQRTTIVWHVPFDRVIVLAPLVLAGFALAIWATPLPVRLTGLLIAVISLRIAARLWLREWRTPAADRGCEVIEETVGRHPC